MSPLFASLCVPRRAALGGRDVFGCYGVHANGG